MKKNYQDLINKINQKNFILRHLIMIFGVFMLALTFNTFLLKNSFVVGGASATGIIFEKTIGIPSAITILIFSITTLFLGILFLERETIKKSIIGSLLYPFFVNLTAPLAVHLNEFLEIESTILIVMITGILMGVSSGIIFKSGYNTGGSDVLTLLANKYLKTPIGKSSLMINAVIIVIGGFIFGVSKMLFSITIIVISTTLVDRILIGISDSKMFFIYTKKHNEVIDFIHNRLNAGTTILDVEGGYTKNKQKMIICVVPNRDYYVFKESILEIDPTTFFVINDCYEVSGGKKRGNLPFI